MALLKIFILVLLATVISVISSRSIEYQETDILTEKQLSHDREELSKKFDCPSRNYGKYPHPQSCEHYFECRSGRPTLKHCSRGDLYDEAKEECRDRRRVRCRRDDDSKEDKDDKKTSRRPETTTTKKATKTTTQVSITTEVISKNFDCPSRIYGKYPHPQSCEHYFECRSGRSTLKHCSRGDLYDEGKEECREKKKVQCRRDGKKEDEDDQKEEEFKCPYASGKFAHPIDCSKFYVCKYNLPTLFQCRNSELFDERSRECHHENRVKCGKRLDRDGMKTSRRPARSTTTTPVFTTTVASTTTEAITVSTIKEIPTTTVSTTISTTVEPTTTTTPAPISTTTPEPTISTLESTTTSTFKPTTTATPEPTTTTTAEPSTTTTPEPTTITTSEPTITMTPETPTTTAEPAASTTESPTTEFPVTKPNTPPPTDCDEGDLDCIIDDTGDVNGWFDCPEQYGHFPHGSSRQLFIHCDNWKPFVKKCADETVFSPEYLVCVWVY